MNRKWVVFLIISCLALLLGYGSATAEETGPQVPGAPLGSTFTYQGRLFDGGSPASEPQDFIFSLWDAISGGLQVGVDVLINDLPLSDGYFTAVLDFGAGVFDGQARWLQVRVRPGDSTGSYTTLTPRQAITAVPYALHAADAWILNGNSGTNPASNFLGTNDNTALELRVNGTRALRLEPDPVSPNLIGGYSANWVTSGVVGATLFGGRFWDGTSYPNRITDVYGTVSGGADNQAGDNIGTTSDARFATVGGGCSNAASGPLSTVSGGCVNASSGTRAMVGGGYNNRAGGFAATIAGGSDNIAAGDHATVSGGMQNNASNGNAAIGGGSNQVASGDHATIGGGQENTASEHATTVAGGESNTASGYVATVSGGMSNTASGESSAVGGGYLNNASGNWASVIGGGWMNTAIGDASTVAGGRNNQASGENATVGGGEGNTASGVAATVPGGGHNFAGGDRSFAAGNYAKADDNGAFVWADGNGFEFHSAGENSFDARATGGFRLVAGIDGTGAATWACSFGSGSAWSCTSDRGMKENFRAVDNQVILEQVNRLAVQTWNAKGTDADVIHLGPTAQDFYAAFGLGDDEKSISTIDLDGVALVAIQGLYDRLEEKEAAIQVQQEAIRQLQAQNASLEARLQARLERLETGTSGLGRLPYLGLALLGMGVALVAKKRGGER